MWRRVKIGHDDVPRMMVMMLSDSGSGKEGCWTEWKLGMMMSSGWWWWCCLACTVKEGHWAEWILGCTSLVMVMMLSGWLAGPGEEGGRGWLYLHPHAPGMGGPQLIVSPKLWRGSLIMSMISIMFMKMRMIDNDTALCVKQWKLRRSKVPKRKIFFYGKKG